MNYYAVLEKPHDELSARRALFFRQAFGGMAVPLLVDDGEDGFVSVSLHLPMTEGEKPYFRAAVFRDEASGERFKAVCMTRSGGEVALSVALRLGFYPVNVDGITIAATETELFRLV